MFHAADCEVSLLRVTPFDLSVLPHRTSFRQRAVMQVMRLVVLSAWIFGLHPALVGAAGPQENPAAADEFDVVVVGGTPGGIAAAVTAARLGRKVALTEYHRRLGAMSASGLGASDITKRAVIQGFFREFVDRVLAEYTKVYGPDSEQVKACDRGYKYEPSVAERIFNRLVEEQPSLTVLRFHEFEKAETRDNRVVAVTLKNRATGAGRTLRGKVFLDATYEGDVYASAGADFRVGRESRDEFGEPHAGHIYVDYKTKITLGGTGAADRRIPAYTYRLCVTVNPANQVPMTQPPPDYDRTRYLGYLDDFRSTRFDRANVMLVAFTLRALPNQKTDVNSKPTPLGFVFVEENQGYATADWKERERIATRIRNLSLGLLWFLQHDESVPPDSREFARKYHLCRDEFTDNGHFPFQLYVREARRLVGEYTLSERNATEQPGVKSERRHPDAIAVGEFPIDSFPTQKRQPGDTFVLEGYLGMLTNITRPYQIPYRIMIPQKLDGLIVPVAASTTHVAFSSIRLEPTWMALGQAAAVAAHLSIKHQIAPRKVPYAELREILLSQGAILDLPADTSR